MFLFAGQSNMAGADSVIEPPGFVQTDADRDTLFTYAPGPGDASSESYYPWGDIRGHHTLSPEHPGRLVHGPEVGFARTLCQAGIRNLAIIKVSANIPPTEDVWLWARGEAFHEAWMKFVDDRIVDLVAEGRGCHVCGFVWHQGIDDALNPKRAPLYAENLTALIHVLRERFGRPDAPFILARSVDSGIARGMTGSGPEAPMALVRAAQMAVADADPYAAWIDVDDQPNVATHHLTAAGQLVVGKRFAEAYLNLTR